MCPIAQDWKITPYKADLLYKHRFSIESGYRDKHKFQIFTCTKILSTRLLVYLFAVLLWNCWQSFLIWMHTLRIYIEYNSRQLSLLFIITWIRINLKMIMFI